ncbi:MAG: hypothetical protein [Caudoviricetes sp.]|nr:MAG: hypothetical protein [Caudoviricetes sp.]
MNNKEAKEINVGDRVRVEGNKFITKGGKGERYTVDVPAGELLVCAEGEVEKEQNDTFWISREKVSIECVRSYPHHFTKVEDQYFAGLGVGVSASDPVPKPFKVVTEVTTRADVTPVVTLPHIVTQTEKPELGVYRPNLEDRKVGKVRVELVDDGFPLALREIAKVMTWAQTAKGYKDHDWQNLPNPEQGLGGATSRHRSDNIIQRMVEKKPALECVDHESEILHKAHEAFGVLAQLELILRGVIK